MRGEVGWEFFGGEISEQEGSAALDRATQQKLGEKKILACLEGERAVNWVGAASGDRLSQVREQGPSTLAYPSVWRQGHWASCDHCVFSYACRIRTKLSKT